MRANTVARMNGPIDVKQRDMPPAGFGIAAFTSGHIGHGCHFYPHFGHSVNSVSILGLHAARTAH